MARQRVDNYILEIEGPQSTISTEKTASVCVQEVLSCDFKAVKKTLIENAQFGTDDGVLPPIAGLYFDNAKASLEMHCEGTRAVAAHSASASATGLSLMLGAVAQCAPTAFVRSKVASGAAGSIVEDLAQAHKPTTNSDGKTAIALVAVQKVSSGLVELMPAIYTGSATLQALNELSFVPSLNDIVYAGLNFQFTKQPASPYYITIRQLGNDQKQNRKGIGCVGNMSIPAVAPNENPKLSFNFVCASGSVNFADTRPAASHQMPSVYAGSDCKLGVAGSELMPVCGRAEITLGTDFVAEKCPESKEGIQAWLRNSGNGELKLTVPHDFVPSSLTDGPVYDSWTEYLESGGNETFHYLGSYGQKKPGSIFGVYFPQLVLVSVEDGEEDSYGVCTLTFKPKKDSVYAPWIVSLA